MSYLYRLTYLDVDVNERRVQLVPAVLRDGVRVEQPLEVDIVLWKRHFPIAGRSVAIDPQDLLDHRVPLRYDVHDQGSNLQKRA